MANSYAIVGPPFNFLGHLTETQKKAFFQWVNQQKPKLPGVQSFHQIRAQQLRKSAGMLEAYYKAQADALAPTFIKNEWKPDQDGHFAYAHRNDHVPAMTVANIKKVFETSLVHMDDAVFHMNHLRAQIEKHEDKAQYASEGAQRATEMMDKLETLFGQPEYQATLVRDTTDTYKGQPRFRVHQLDSPTPWERDTRTGRTPSST